MVNEEKSSTSRQRILSGIVRKLLKIQGPAKLSAAAAEEINQSIALSLEFPGLTIVHNEREITDGRILTGSHEPLDRQHTQTKEIRPMPAIQLDKPRPWTKNERETLATFLASKIRSATQGDHDLLQGALQVLTAPSGLLNDNLDQLRELQDLRPAPRTARPQTMSMRTFIRSHRSDIDAVIRARGGGLFNDKERELWVLNDDGLFLWAKSEGMDI